MQDFLAILVGPSIRVFYEIARVDDHHQRTLGIVASLLVVENMKRFFFMLGMLTDHPCDVSGSRLEEFVGSHLVFRPINTPMRARDILLEYDLHKTAARYATAIHTRMHGDLSGRGISVYRTAAKYSTSKASRSGVEPAYSGDNSPWEAAVEKYFSEFVTAEIARMDPTEPRGKYIQWLITRYINKGIQRWEDFSRARVALEKFDNIKNSGYFRRTPDDAQLADINRFKTLPDLEDFVERVSGSGKDKSNAEKEREIEATMIAEGDALVFADTSEMKIIVPKTEEASCYFGRNTRWCTAATEGQNYFDTYNRQGNLYIVLDKANNRRWQLHFASGQFMNERDVAIDSFDNPILQAALAAIGKHLAPHERAEALATDPMEDGAGLPDWFENFLITDLPNADLMYVLFWAIGYKADGNWLDFLRTEVDKRYPVDFSKTGNVLDFGEDFLEFLYAVSYLPLSKDREDVLQNLYRVHMYGSVKPKDFAARAKGCRYLKVRIKEDDYFVCIVKDAKNSPDKRDAIGFTGREGSWNGSYEDFKTLVTTAAEYEPRHSVTTPIVKVCKAILKYL